MLGRNYESQICSVARTLEIVGERWTLLIVRDALLGLRRFEDFQEDLGVARNILADRLRRLVEHGILERVRYQERPERFEYQLTERGRELMMVVFALMHWGDRHLAGPEGLPRLTQHAGCGGSVEERHVCSRCGRVLEASDVDVLPGPALTATLPAG
jgi:DNA-binding HxlR family transcriptional regulator